MGKSPVSNLDLTQWIEQPRWRCEACHRACDCWVCAQMPSKYKFSASRLFWGLDFGRHPRCPVQECKGAVGTYQMRNLYEINEEIIMPACEPSRVSYVELLRRREANT